jgi:hypothetical protein
MDACDPGINIRNLKKLVKQNTGLELKLTRAEICDAYSSIQDGKLPLPPMVLSKDGKYMLDRKSPLNGRDFEILFSGSSRLDQLKRVARKVGLSSYDKMTKSQISDAIESSLKSKNIREPIRLHISAQKRVVSVNNNNNNNNNRGNYASNFNVNNKNGNLNKISNESENLGKNNQNETKNLNRISNESKNLNNDANNNTKAPVNSTTARYLNAMRRTPNANRNTDIAKILSAMKNKNQSPGNISRLIESVQRKKSTNGETNVYLNKFIRAQKQGNVSAMRNAAKRLNAFERNKRSVINEAPPVNQKQKKLSNLEKYMINKSKNLGTNRVKFLNEGQKFIRGYKNGNNMYNTTKARINSLHNEIYKKKLNETKISNVVNSLQKNKINKIANSKIKNEASRLLEEFKKTGSNATRNQIIKLQGLDQGLREKEESSRKILGNTRALNDVRNEALQNISSYNIRNGLSKINMKIQQTKNERRKNITDLFENNKYKNVRENTKKSLTNRYINGDINWNSVMQNLNFSISTPNNRPKIVRRKLSFPSKMNESVGRNTNIAKLESESRNKNIEIQSLRNRLRNQNLTTQERNRLQKLLIKKESEYQTLMNESASKNTELEKLRRKKQKAETIINNLKRNQESKNTELQSLRNRLSNQSLTIQQRNKLQNLLTKKKMERNKLQEELENKQTQINEISKERESFRANKTLAQQKITELTNKLNSRNQNIARLMNEYGSKNMELMNLRNKKQKAQSIIKELTNKLKSTNQNIARLMNECGSKNVELVNLRNKKQRAQTIIKELTNKQKSKNAELTSKNTEIQSLRNRLGNQNLTIKQRNALKKLLNNSRREKETLKTEIKQLTGQIEANMTTKEKLTKAVEGSKSTISRLNKLVEKLQQELESTQINPVASKWKRLATKAQQQALNKEIRAGEKNLSKVTSEMVNWRKENPFTLKKNPIKPPPPIIQKYRKQPIPYVNTRKVVNYRPKKSYANAVRGNKKQTLNQGNIESALKRL